MNTVACRVQATNLGSSQPMSRIFAAEKTIMNLVARSADTLR
ncbi:hypothetical protein AB0E63_06645 [Kribbella sp. NPDC026596]